MIKSRMLLLYSIFIFIACTNHQIPTQNVEIRPLNLDKYTAVYPRNDPSKIFSHLSSVVKRVQMTSYYTSYYFSIDQKITPKMLQFQSAKKLAEYEKIISNTKTGTAIPINHTDQGILMITCEHVVSTPDTILTFRKNEDGADTPYLSSFTLIDRNDYLVFDTPDLSPFKVLAKKKETDLALVHVPLDMEDANNVDLLPFKLGDSEDLQWGSLVWIFGFPQGNKMLTHGIVSDPQKDINGYFLTDAYFNRGISGGLVVALRGESPNFEWIGIANAAASETEYILTPNTRLDLTYDEGQVYTDTIFVEKRKVLKNGITRSIHANAIRSFLLDYMDVYEDLGYDLSEYLIQE